MKKKEEVKRRRQCVCTRTDDCKRIEWKPLINFLFYCNVHFPSFLLSLPHSLFPKKALNGHNCFTISKYFNFFVHTSTYMYAKYYRNMIFFFFFGGCNGMSRWSDHKNNNKFTLNCEHSASGNTTLLRRKKTGLARWKVGEILMLYFFNANFLEWFLIKSKTVKFLKKLNSHFFKKKLKFHKTR